MIEHHYSFVFILKAMHIRVFQSKMLIKIVFHTRCVVFCFFVREKRNYTEEMFSSLAAVTPRLFLTARTEVASSDFGVNIMKCLIRVRKNKIIG